MACIRARINLVACEGSTFEKKFVWKSGPKNEAVPVDLTGYEGECHIRDKIGDEEAVFILENGVGVVIDADQTEDGNRGHYKLYIDDEVTRDECPGYRDRKMVYDLRLVAPDGTVRLQQYGEFKLQPAVTRPWLLET